MSRDDRGSLDFERRAAELDRLTDVPTDVLAHVVERDGTCWWEVMNADPPRVTDEAMPDRALAAQLCGGCPIQRECVELELRTAGATTTGVWGGLCEVDRRALHTAWHARRTRAVRRQDTDGGGQ